MYKDPQFAYEQVYVSCQCSTSSIRTCKRNLCFWLDRNTNENFFNPSVVIRVRSWERERERERETCRGTNAAVWGRQRPRQAVRLSNVEEQWSAGRIGGGSLATLHTSTPLHRIFSPATTTNFARNNTVCEACRSRLNGTRNRGNYFL